MKWKIAYNSDSLRELEEGMMKGHIVELAEERDDGSELVYFEKAEVGALGGLTMHIYAKEHPPPHFHVKYNGEENSFRLDNAKPLYPNGGLKKWFKNIRKWHKSNKAELVQFWNDSRPDDCPVGPITS